jgi:hypothetical protein
VERLASGESRAESSAHYRLKFFAVSRLINQRVKSWRYQLRVDAAQLAFDLATRRPGIGQRLSAICLAQFP